jgi:hypothetical protein
MKFATSLTSSEGKRLIAKGVAALPSVRKAWEEGILVIGRGTTNALLVEELTGEQLDRGSYSAGITVPAHKRFKRLSYDEYLFEKGEKLTGTTSGEVAKQMKRGDVFVKGANALNYASGIAGVLIGDLAGGTLGAYPLLVARKIELVIPVGLEKEIATDLMRAAELIREPGVELEGVPSLFPIQGTVITEIEAIAVLTGATALQIGAGGVNGAEGAVWLMVSGAEEVIAEAWGLLDSIKGEPPITLPEE